MVLVAIAFRDVMSKGDVFKAEIMNLKHELIIGFDSLKDDFQQYIDVQGAESLFLDAKYATESDVSTILLHVKEILSDIVRQVPEVDVPQVCEKVRLASKDRCLVHPNQPIMTIKEFKRAFYDCKGVDVPDNDDTWDDGKIDDRNAWETQFFAVAAYLTYTGEIIYFENLDLVVVSPHRLMQGALGKIIHTFIPGCGSSTTSMPRMFGDKGFLEKDAWESLLQLSLDKAGVQEQVMSVGQLNQLMLKLHLCYERRNKRNVVEGYFFPILLDKLEDMMDKMASSWLGCLKQTTLSNVFSQD